MRACIHEGAAQIGGPRVEVEAQGRRILLDLGLDGGLRVDGTAHLEDRKPISAGPFTITPFLVDPSVHDASAILVEAEGVSMLYIGDLRAGILEKLLLARPPHVDVLLMEGATIAGANSADGFPAEADFEDQFAILFRMTRGMPLVWCSPQHVDRLVTICRACLRTNRQFIVDFSTTDTLRAAGVAAGPLTRAAWDRIRVFVPASERRQTKRMQAEASAESNDPPRISSEELAAAAGASVMLFRPSMMQDLEQARCLADARLIFSMWSGYLEYEKSNPFLEWLDRHAIPLDQCHTSGRAGISELIELRRAFATAPVVPIGRHPERFDRLFGPVERRANGEWWEVLRT